MTLVQIRDVPPPTVDALKALAAERGLTLAAFLRGELERMATRPTNADIVERLRSRRRTGGPTADETVAEIRQIRTTS